MTMQNPLDPDAPEEGDEVDEGDPGNTPWGGYVEGDYYYTDGGLYRYSLQPDGKVMKEVWNPRGGADRNGGYDRVGTPSVPVKGSYFYRSGTSGGGSPGTSAAQQNAATAAAREERLAAAAAADAEYKRERQIRADALAAEQLQIQKDELAYKKAIDQRDYDEARRIRERQQERQDRIDKLNEEQQQADNKFRQDQARTQKDIARGYVDGMPTLTREQWEAEQANQPGNYYNYAFRSRGEEPPSGMPALTGAAAPTTPGMSTAATRDIADWRNMDIPTILATFSATELARLPLEAASQLPNEALLKIGAEYPGGVTEYLKLFPRERLIGAGQWQGTGFGEDVLASLEQSATPAVGSDLAGREYPVTPADQRAPGVLPVGGVGPPLTSSPQTQGQGIKTLGQGGETMGPLLQEPGVVQETITGPGQYPGGVPPLQGDPRNAGIPVSTISPSGELPIGGVSAPITDPRIAAQNGRVGRSVQQGGETYGPTLNTPVAPLRRAGGGGETIGPLLQESGQPGRSVQQGGETYGPLLQEPGRAPLRTLGQGGETYGSLLQEPGQNPPGVVQQTITGPRPPLRRPGGAGSITRDPSGMPQLTQGGRNAPLPPALRNVIAGKSIPTYRSQGNLPALSAQSRSRMTPSERQVWDVTVNRTGGRAEDAAWRDRELTSGGTPGRRIGYRGMPSLTRR